MALLYAEAAHAARQYGHARWAAAEALGGARGGAAAAGGAEAAGRLVARATLLLAAATLRGVGGERSVEYARAVLAGCAPQSRACADQLEAADRASQALERARRLVLLGVHERAGDEFARLLAEAGVSDAAHALRRAAATEGCEAHVRAATPVWERVAAEEAARHAARIARGEDGGAEDEDDPDDLDDAFEGPCPDEEGADVAEGDADSDAPLDPGLAKELRCDASCQRLAGSMRRVCGKAQSANRDLALGGDAEAEDAAALAHYATALARALVGRDAAAIAALDQIAQAARAQQHTELRGRASQLRAALQRRLGGADTLYEIIGVDRNATVGDIRRGYRARAKDLHPDRARALGLSCRAARRLRRRFVALAYAHEVLSDPRRREIYDRDLAAKERAGESTRVNFGSEGRGEAGWERPEGKGGPANAKGSYDRKTFRYVPPPVQDIAFDGFDAREMPSSGVVLAWGENYLTGERVQVNITINGEPELGDECRHKCLGTTPEEAAAVRLAKAEWRVPVAMHDEPGARLDRHRTPLGHQVVWGALQAGTRACATPDCRQWQPWVDYTASALWTANASTLRRAAVISVPLDAGEACAIGERDEIAVLLQHDDDGRPDGAMARVVLITADGRLLPDPATTPGYYYEHIPGGDKFRTLIAPLHAGRGGARVAGLMVVGVPPVEGGGGGAGEEAEEEEEQGEGGSIDDLVDLEVAAELDEGEGEDAGSCGVARSGGGGGGGGESGCAASPDDGAEADSHPPNTLNFKIGGVRVIRKGRLRCQLLRDTVDPHAAREHIDRARRSAAEARAGADEGEEGGALPRAPPSTRRA